MPSDINRYGSHPVYPSSSSQTQSYARSSSHSPPRASSSNSPPQISYVPAEPAYSAGGHDQYAGYREEDRHTLGDYHAQPQWNTPVSMGQNPYAQVQNHTLYGRGGPQPKHIRQSNVGDCHVLASLAGVASDPNAIRHMVQEQAPGAYRVNLHDPRTLQQVQVHVDDTLPSGMEPSFHRSQRQNVLWPHMVEKGYAKLHDASESAQAGSSGTSTRQVVGYQDLEGGTGIHAMQSFTGRTADCLAIRNMSDGTLVQHLSKANTPGVAVIAGSHFGRAPGMSSRVETAHAYTVIGTRTSRSTGEIMVGLRNPHGGDQYPVLGTRNDNFEMPLSKFKASFETVTCPYP